jgi:hypothetical protein
MKRGAKKMETEQKVTGERVAARIVEIAIRRCLELGVPPQVLADELLCAGAATLSEALGPTAATACLRQAADAAEQQLSS